MKTIVRLDSSIINRIAAGEIIHHPYNAVKELIENSLDSGSKHIHIHLTTGGLDMIQIRDDGYGIKVDDMPLVCERYATSKLQDFKDLQKLHTFGFRGEALASISHIAKVTITSKSKDDTYGYQAIYRNGNILSTPKLCASNYGTMISIQNLFHNTPSRKKALKSPNEEYHRIADIVKKYAIHNTSIVFTLKKVHKETNVEIPDQRAVTPIERIQQIYGSNIASSLKAAEYTDSKSNFKIFFSDIKTAGDKEKKNNNSNIFIIFVNNRLVENVKMKKQVKQVYTSVKPNYKPPFIYLSLNVNPSHIDVNIHPTKNEVHLLDQDQIIENITKVLKNALSASSKKKQKNPPAPLPEKATLNHYFKPINKRRESVSSASESTIDTPPLSPIPIRKQNLDYYFKKIENRSTAEDSNPSLSGRGSTTTKLIPRQRAQSVTAISQLSSQKTSPPRQGNKKKRAGVFLTKVNNSSQTSKPFPITLDNRPSSTVITQAEEEENLQELESIITIQSEIKDAEDKRLSKMFSKHQYVGCIDNVLALMLYNYQYYLINYNVVSEEFLYQTVIRQIGKFGRVHLSTPILIRSCISLRMPTATPQDVHRASVSILAHRELLKSYYNIEVISSKDEMDVYVAGLPMLVRDYVPSLDKFPEFLFNLATQIIWDNEIECLDALAHELASFYCCTSVAQWEKLLPAIYQGGFKSPRSLTRDMHIMQLDLPMDSVTKK